MRESRIGLASLEGVVIFVESHCEVAGEKVPKSIQSAMGIHQPSFLFKQIGSDTAGLGHRREGVGQFLQENMKMVTEKKTDPDLQRVGMRLLPAPKS